MREVERNTIKSYANLAKENLVKNGEVILRKAIAKLPQYRRTVLSRGEKITVFNADVRKCNGYTYIVYVKSYGKSDMKKRGFIFYIVTPFTVFGHKYYIHFCNEYKVFEVFTQHFFDRYIERHLKDGRTFDFDVISKYLSETDCIGYLQKIDSEKYGDCCYSSTRIGVSCGYLLDKNVVLYKTYIDNETIEKGAKADVKDKGSEFFKKIFNADGQRVMYLD